MKIRFKLIAIVIAVLMAIYAIPLGAYAELFEMAESDAEEKDILITEDDIAEEAYIFEDESLRDENVKHFKLDDGSYIAARYPYVVHVKDENGTWQDIDNNLADKGSEYSTSNARVKFAKKTTGNETLFTLHDGNYKITMSLDGANKKIEGKVTNNIDAESETNLQKMLYLEKLSSSIVYSDILDGVDLEYVVDSLNIKENIIVKEKSDRYSYTFTLKLNNLSAILNDDGSVSVFDSKTNEIVYVIPSPVVYDAKGVYAEADKASYALSDCGNGKYILTVTADSEWMNADERAFPVVIDPTVYINLYDDMSDTFISSASTTSYFGGYTYMDSGHGTSGQEYIAYWMSDVLPSIPDNAYITSANLSLNLRSYNTSASIDELLLGVYTVTSSWTSYHTWTDLTNGTNGTIGTLYECVGVSASDVNKYVSFNITDIARQWIDGTLTNYGVAIRQIGTDRAYARFDATNKQSNMPCLTVNYHTQKGLESYWSYFTHDLPVGTGYVNLASGELILNIPTISTTEAIFGFTPSLVYNSGIYNEYNTNENNDNVPHIVTSAGYGWRLNVNESVVKKTYTDADGATATYYVLADSDGTEHAFYLDKTTNTYKDEDGLLLTLTENSNYYHIEDSSHTIKSYRKITNNTSSNEGAVLNIITDKFGNKLKVYNYTNGRCNGIAFCPVGGSDVSHLTLSYNSAGCISAITNSASGHKVTFEYSSSTSGSASASSGGYLKRMIFSKTSGSTTTNYSEIEFSYRSSGQLYIVREALSGQRMYYGYSSEKVAMIQEKGSDSSGQSIGITYGNNTTSVRSSGTDDINGNADDILTHYTFDSHGRAVSTYSSSVDKTQIYGATIGTYDEQATNKIKTSAVSGGMPVNYLLNGNLEAGGSSAISYWSVTGNISKAMDSETCDLHAVVDVNASTTDSLSQHVRLPNGKYTISAKLTTKNCSDVSIYLKAILTSSESSKEIPKSEAEINSELSPNLTFEVNGESGYEDVQIMVQVNGSATVSSDAEVTIDDIMLEQGIGSSECSPVNMGSFEESAITISGSTNLSVFSAWDRLNAPSATFTSDSGIVGTGAKIVGNISSKQSISQTVNILSNSVGTGSTTSPQKSASNVYIFSGLAKGSHQVSYGAFGFKVTATYTGNNGSQEYFFPCNDSVTDVQYVSGIISVPDNKYIASLKIECVYDNNPGVAYFDNISVVPVTDSSVAEYTYTTKGYVSSVRTPEVTTRYEYDLYGNLTREENDYGNLVTYSYDVDTHALTDKTVCTVYEIAGLPYTEVNTYTTYIYSDHGLLTREMTRGAGNSTTYLTTSYSYDVVTTSMTFGKLLSYTDENSNTTQYVYDSSTGDLVYQVAPDGVSGLYYTYDNIGRLIEVTPIEYSYSVNQYSPIYGEEAVEYTYNELMQLSGIDTATTSYTFTYDTYGNTESIKAGNNTLATYAYNSYNGKLASMTYGNGTVVTYSYDTLDRIEKISYNGVVRYEYQYTSDGKLHSVTDLIANRGYLYDYDGSDRLTGYAEYVLDAKTNVLSIKYLYNNKNQLSKVENSLDYLVGSTTQTVNWWQEYSYDEKSNLLEKLVINSDAANATNSPSSITVDYLYDIVQRPTGKVYTIEGASQFANTVSLTYNDRSTMYSTQVKSYSTQVGTNAATTYTYTYDQNGNITRIVDNAGKITQYTYDDLGQLIREDNPYLNQSYTYTYDNNGNRLTHQIYAYKTGTLGTATHTFTYTYDNTAWGDRLIGLNNAATTYDTIGNPLTYNAYYSYTFTWTDGRRLATARRGNSIYKFTYNDEGIRTSKTSNGVKHTYVLDGSRIVSEQFSNILLVYMYDESGSPIGMQCRTKSGAEGAFYTYYFEKNLQGDIIAVYDANGTKLISYTYNAWGAHTVTKHVENVGAAQYNPFRYRGYYYDADLEFYYLNSRYYDPYTGRFINADGHINANGDVIGYNMYAYCSNNPIMFTDHTGEGLFSNLWGFITQAITNVIDAFIGSIEAQAGLGYGLGGAISISGVDVSLNVYKDTFVSFEDGQVCVGNIASNKVGVGDLAIGDTYKHITDKWNEYVDYCPHCVLGYATIEAMSTCPTAKRGSENNDIILFEVSADFHAIFGGHYSFGFNLTKFVNRLFD